MQQDGLHGMHSSVTSGRAVILDGVNEEEDLSVIELVLHLSVDDVLGADDALNDERVPLPRSRNLFDDDVMPEVAHDD